MKALVLERYNAFVFKDVEMPQVGEKDVLIKIKACSVCGSDVQRDGRQHGTAYPAGHYGPRSRGRY